MAVKNMAASVLARLRNQARDEGIPYQTCLQLFFQEEFLRRLSKSNFRENMILKGGMFIYTLTEFNSRPTRDMDFMIRWVSNDVENVREIMAQICSISTENDYIRLEVTGAEQITLEKKYPGVKTKMRGFIGNVRVPFSIDVGIDDVIVPEAAVRKIATRLEGFEQPEIYTYSLESTIAEKFDAIIDRMEATSRMKDFFDIYYLSNIFDFDGVVLSEAVRSTMQHRNRTVLENAFTRIRQFPELEFFKHQWESFQPAKESELAFPVVIDRLIVFMEPIYTAVQSKELYSAEWSCHRLTWE